jgi:hypothetical protein
METLNLSKETLFLFLFVLIKNTKLKQLLPWILQIDYIEFGC